MLWFDSNQPTARVNVSQISVSYVTKQNTVAGHADRYDRVGQKPRASIMRNVK